MENKGQWFAKANKGIRKNGAKLGCLEAWWFALVNGQNLKNDEIIMSFEL